MASTLGLRTAFLPEAYTDSLAWADELVRIEQCRAG